MTELASVIATFGTLIAEAVIAHQTRDDLKAAIKQVAPIRFQLKILEEQGRVWDQFQLNITAAADTWITLQELADGGQNCYVDADIALAQKIDAATVDMIEAFSAITNETIYQQLEDEDKRSNGGDPWLNDEPSFEEIMNEVYGDGAAIDPEDLRQAEDNIAASQDENVVGLDPAAVNATNGRYFELAENKGALWKLSEPFRSYQEGPSSAADGAATVRHRLQEDERTDSEIKLTLMATDGDSSVDAEPLTIDLPGSKITFKGADLPLDESANSNLIPTNGWNAYYVPLNVTADTDEPFVNAFECNRVAGWKLTWSDSGGGGFASDMFQRFRDGGRVHVSAKKRNGDPKDPAADADFVANTIRITESDEDIDQTFDIYAKGVLPRTTID